MQEQIFFIRARFTNMLQNYMAQAAFPGSNRPTPFQEVLMRAEPFISLFNVYSDSSFMFKTKDTQFFLQEDCNCRVSLMDAPRSELCFVFPNCGQRPTASMQNGKSIQLALYYPASR